MSSRADRGRIPALGGTNPDYYQETASIYGDGGSGDPNHRRRRRRRRDEHHHHHHHPSTPPVAPQPIAAPQPGLAYNSAPPPAYTYHNPHQPTTQPSPPPQQHHGSGRYSPPPPPKPPRPVISHQPGSSLGAGLMSGALMPTGTGLSSSSQSNNINNNSTNPNKDKRTLSERLHQLSLKAGTPINKLTNALGSEAFWPSTMDQECDKAARIIQSFCSSSSSSSSSSSLLQIPPRVLTTCSGLAIFTVFRTGLHLSGSSGSGIVISRLPSGGTSGKGSSWSPPSGFLIHSLGAGLLAGIDIYDCICVLRTPAAVRAFAERSRVSLGGDVGIVAGPVGAGAGVEGVLRSGSSSMSEKDRDNKEGKPLVYSYIKSRGLYAGVSMDGTVVVPRGDANAEFYGRRGISVEEILRGDVPWPEPGRGGKDGKKVWPEGAMGLMETLRTVDKQARRKERNGDHGCSSRAVDDEWAYED
ncbi:hypothetical protein SMACR_03925 [Sordaria macrospora]|uniref:WGS project CABT00000000 data, contig 2.17 n=2 Tax=Sordaria macrospora TaxID=5147 RepID=F7W0C0_SORMK|nr:uncharacterized protein SMAC_03925 [Sordaria macrospora k-hell]KAA8634973.1 hypothetical protein SMACR_03925 [Sordaria macrospora]KAH7633257.1 hypothetical protein B0T09DRAFT_333383 [Sordaria sp. MPI-SDFR-AT-0083]WPJ60336.1 hypothetical protein SMAC4_03925 [Sordaria macrospora]CCC11220.1 unnamed protein product [Sordaria macrospora k-hell]